MQTLRKILIALGLLVVSNMAQAYDYLQIQHPQQTWRTGQGTIEQAVISIKPQGIYMEYGLYLTFSARGLSFFANDSVEVQFFFDLPKEAIVHDLWLWVDDQIMRALIMDRWTASSIYEDIVKRRRDPAILFKNDENSYELRIYPMPGNKTRKIKLTYLMPAQWLPTSVIAGLPTNLLRTSRTPLSVFHLLFWPHTDWANPRLQEFPGLPFIAQQDTAFGDYVRAEIPTEAVAISLNFALDSPMQNGVFVSKFQNSDEGIYQLALLPSQALDLQAAKKVAILFDYDASKSPITATEVLAGAKTMLQSNFTASDSFNLIFSRATIQRAGEHWFAADSAGVAQAFANAGDQPIANYSNLPALLANAIDFVKQQGNDGSLLLLACSDQAGYFLVANPLLEDLLRNLDPAPPIHIADFAGNNTAYYWNGGRYYFGNEYFYENLARRTVGSYLRLNQAGNSFSALLTGVSQSLSGFIDAFDLHTTLSGGFCYGRFALGNSSNHAVYLDRPILQVGKFAGEFPFVIEASGFYRGTPFSRVLNLAENETAAADTLAEEIWIGNHIASLEAQPSPSNEMIREIIDTSVRERVLSRYTAFLALEPNDTVKVCLDCKDETVLVPPTSVFAREETPADSVLQAYPNPFNAATTLRLRLPANLNSGEVSLRIYNVMGQIVRAYDVTVEAESRLFQFTWEGRDAAGQTLATGTYYAVLQTPAQRYSVKLLMVK